MDRRILVNRDYFVNGKWYDPAKFLEDNFKSVIRVDYYDTTSSSGDWSGIILQKIGKSTKAIIFSQENVSDGFNVTTNDSVLCEFNNDTPTHIMLDESFKILNNLY